MQLDITGWSDSFYCCCSFVCAVCHINGRIAYFRILIFEVKRHYSADLFLIRNFAPQYIRKHRFPVSVHKNKDRAASIQIFKRKSSANINGNYGTIAALDDRNDLVCGRAVVITAVNSCFNELALVSLKNELLLGDESVRVGTLVFAARASG